MHPSEAVRNRRHMILASTLLGARPRQHTIQPRLGLSNTARRPPQCSGTRPRHGHVTLTRQLDAGPVPLCEDGRLAFMISTVVMKGTVVVMCAVVEDISRGIGRMGPRQAASGPRLCAVALSCKLLPPVLADAHIEAKRVNGMQERTE